MQHLVVKSLRMISRERSPETLGGGTDTYVTFWVGPRSKPTVPLLSVHSFNVANVQIMLHYKLKMFIHK
jgi:hypothetical protein